MGNGNLRDGVESNVMDGRVGSLEHEAARNLSVGVLDCVKAQYVKMVRMDLVHGTFAVKVSSQLRYWKSFAMQLLVKK